MSWKSFAILFLTTTYWAAPAIAAEEADQSPVVSGRDEYVWNCAECHGQDGRGKGPLASALIKPPADLTQIAKYNLGVFPEEKVFEIISGAGDVMGHQSFQMPKFWERFQRSEGNRGYDPADVRIKAIIDHLKTLQEH